MSCCNRETNDHLQVMFYWITITGGRLQAIPPGLKNRVTDNSLCHQERQINIHTSNPPMRIWKQILSPSWRYNNKPNICYNTYRASPERPAHPGGVCIKWNVSTCVSICCCGLYLESITAAQVRTLSVMLHWLVIVCSRACLMQHNFPPLMIDKDKASRRKDKIPSILLETKKMTLFSRRPGMRLLTAYLFAREIRDYCSV